LLFAGNQPAEELPLRPLSEAEGFMSFPGNLSSDDQELSALINFSRTKELPH